MKCSFSPEKYQSEKWTKQFPAPSYLCGPLIDP